MDQSRNFRLACCRPGPCVFRYRAFLAQRQYTLNNRLRLHSKRTSRRWSLPAPISAARTRRRRARCRWSARKSCINRATPVHTGSQRPDFQRTGHPVASFSGAFATGASGIALRGLNVGATLVLIDGHRSAPYPIGDDGYRSFVDVANLPFDAIERIEVLKDGASAIYGSDAVAGVVNIIMKRSYQGAQVTADGGVSAHADGWQEHLSGIWGHGDLVNDGYNAYISTEFRKQDAIRFIDRGGTFENRDYSAVGGINADPGAPNFLNGKLPGSKTGYVTDANGNIVGFMKGCNATAFAANQCTYQDTWDQSNRPRRTST